VLALLLCLIDGGDRAAHSFEVAERLEIGQGLRRVGVQDAGQGVVTWQHGLHGVDLVDQVHSPVQVEEDIVDEVSRHAPVRIQLGKARDHRRDQRLGDVVEVPSETLLNLGSSQQCELCLHGIRRSGIRRGA